MTSFITRHRVQDATSDLFVTLLKARSKAIMLNADVKLQPVGGDWAAGWRVPDPTAPGQYVDVHEAAEGVSIAMSGATSITYQFNGRVRNGLAVKFKLSSGTPGHVASACVTVDPSGRPYTEDKPCTG
jgi:type IV fimbrial biogenesis protein FimT